MSISKKQKIGFIAGSLVTVGALGAGYWWYYRRRKMAKK